MSSYSDKVFSLLKELFPELKIRKETFVTHQNQKLYLDFYMPQLSLVIEVHGRQHVEFVRHFHGDKQGFMQSKKRDRIKAEWAAENNIIFLEIHEKSLPKTKEELAELIRSSVGSE